MLQNQSPAYCCKPPTNKVGVSASVSAVWMGCLLTQTIACDPPATHPTQSCLKFTYMQKHACSHTCTHPRTRHWLSEDKNTWFSKLCFPCLRGHTCYVREITFSCIVYSVLESPQSKTNRSSAEVMASLPRLLVVCFALGLQWWSPNFTKENSQESVYIPYKDIHKSWKRDFGVSGTLMYGEMM